MTVYELRTYTLHVGKMGEAVKLYSQLLRDYPDTNHAAEASQRLHAAQKSVATNSN